MSTKEKSGSPNSALLITIFVIYCLLLAKAILFKYSFYAVIYTLKDWSFSVIHRGFMMANLVPFRSIRMYIRYYNLSINSFENLAGNILLFVPMGILLPAIWNWMRKRDWTLAVGLCVSLFFEATQLFTGLGSFDVDDIILNGLGCFIGFLLWELFSRKMKKVEQ